MHLSNDSKVNTVIDKLRNAETKVTKITSEFEWSGLQLNVVTPSFTATQSIARISATKCWFTMHFFVLLIICHELSELAKIPLP